MNFLANKRHRGDDLFTVFLKNFLMRWSGDFIRITVLYLNFMSKSIRFRVNLCICLFNLLKLWTSLLNHYKINEDNFLNMYVPK